MNEKLMTFPCEFPIKVVGKKSDQFEVEVFGIIRKYFTSIAPDALQVRPSKNNNYLAITVNVTAQSQQQLDDMYRELSACDLVIMAL